MAVKKYPGIVSTLYNSTNKIAALKDISIDDSASSVDVTDHDSGAYGEQMPTFSQVKITANLWYLGDTTTGVQDTQHAALLTAKTAFTILTLKHRPVGDGSGKAEISYPVRVTSCKYGAPAAGAQSFDVEFVGTGAPTIGVQA